MIAIDCTYCPSGTTARSGFSFMGQLVSSPANIAYLLFMHHLAAKQFHKIPLVISSLSIA